MLDWENYKAVKSIDNIVAIGKVVGIDPNSKVHDIRLGESNYKVQVLVIMKGCEDVMIPIPVGEEMTRLVDIVKSFIAWSKVLVLNKDSLVSKYCK